MRTQVLVGSCLCRAVSYSITTELQNFYFCHCKQCRKLTGSAFAANIQAVPAAVSWLSGAEYVKRFDLPGERQFTKVFCLACGSGLPFLNKTGDKLFIPAGSLDSTPSLEPRHNIFWQDRAEWYELGVAASRTIAFAD